MYIVIAKDENGDYQITNVKVSEIIGNMKIYDETDMELFRERVNEGKIFVETKVELMQDITLTKEWEPIGTSEKQFLGKFEGNGHSIEGLKIEGKSDNQGLFSYNSGVIKNLEVEGYINSEYQYTGMLVGTNSGTIENITTKGAIIGKKGYIGGVVGINLIGGRISNCTNIADINKGITDDSKFSGTGTGGIAGKDRGGIISFCENSGFVMGRSYIGGICGEFNVIEYCRNTGEVTGVHEQVGGIGGRGVPYGGCTEIDIKRNYGTIRFSCNYGDVISKSNLPNYNYSCTGGMAGRKSCYRLLL